MEYPVKEKYNFDDLVEIVKILRSPGGCPWDREQTHKSIRSNFIEETYEAIEAIDNDDKELLKEELGDVLLQVALHCEMEREENSFDINDVCDGICKKLIIRHPHVFGDVVAEDTQTVLNNWDNIKKETKHQETYTDTLNAVAKSLPALSRAQKVGKRAKKAGMDFRTAEDAFSCIQSEHDELKEAIQSGNSQQIEEEFGDLLFSCVNTARHLGIDAEQALSKATEKFIRRFHQTEQLVTESGRNMPDLPIEELDIYWNQAKETNQE